MYKTKVLKKEILTDDVFELIVEKPNGFKFESGQFITIKIEDKLPPCFRGYSIASSPESPKIKLCIKIVKGGRGSNWLNSLKKDDEINFIGPNGEFTLEENENDILIIATGTGIAPFKSILEKHLKKLEQKIHLIFGLRYVENVFYNETFEALAKKHQNFTYEITLSRPDENWQGSKGRVTEILKNLEIIDREVYICGLKDMIEEVSKILKEKGLSEKMIHFEKYD